MATSSVGIRSGSASRGGSSPIAQEPAAAQQHRMLCCSGTDSPLAGLTAGGVHDVSETDGGHTQGVGRELGMRRLLLEGWERQRPLASVGLNLLEGSCRWGPAQP